MRARCATIHVVQGNQEAAQLRAKLEQAQQEVRQARDAASQAAATKAHDAEQLRTELKQARAQLRNAQAVALAHWRTQCTYDEYMHPKIYPSHAIVGAGTRGRDSSTSTCSP